MWQTPFSDLKTSLASSDLISTMHLSMDHKYLSHNYFTPCL